MSVEPRLAERGQSSGTPRIRRVLTRWDLILYGLVILTPTAPYPVPEGRHTRRRIPLAPRLKGTASSGVGRMT